MPGFEDLRFCGGGGRLVDQNWPVPDDPSDHEDPRDEATIGCNRLFCPRCGAPVRHCPGVDLVEKGRLAPAQLYEIEDWRADAGLKASPGARLYACRCLMWLETTEHYTNPSERDPQSDPVLPWRCAGHPRPKLPIEIDGVPIDATTDLQQLVDRVLHGWVPECAQETLQHVRTYWLQRLFVRLLRTPRGDEVGRAVGARIDHPTEDVRSAALFFFERMSRAPGFESVIQWAETDPVQATQHYEVPGLYYPGPSLLDLVARRLGERRVNHEAADSLDNRAGTLLKDVLTRSGFSWPESERYERLGRLSPREIVERHVRMLAGLADLDPEWFAHNAARIDRGCPGRWQAAIEALAMTDRTDLIAAAGSDLLQDGRISPAELEAWLEDEFRLKRQLSWALVLQVVARESAVKIQ